MSGGEKTVFISYRRSNTKWLARLIFLDLTSHGYDVFLDVDALGVGQVDSIILNQIAARCHFVLLLSEDSLLRCADADDWLRLEIEEAFRLKRNIVPIFDDGFNLQQEKDYLPEPLLTQLPNCNGLPLNYYYFDAGMQRLRAQFLTQRCDERIALMPTPDAEQAEVKRRIQEAAVPPIDVVNILPRPFEWCPIPNGVVRLQNASSDGGTAGGQFEVPAFDIAQYPITNAQYETFVRDDYKDARWWDYSPEAKDWRAEHPTPRNTAFAGADLPRTNVCWFDAVAFCQWLTEKSGQKITLPTEQQWQRAAQGDDFRDYPWGNSPRNTTRCNFNQKVGRPTPVTQYPQGVISMG